MDGTDGDDAEFKGGLRGEFKIGSPQPFKPMVQGSNPCAGTTKNDSATAHTGQPERLLPFLAQAVPEMNPMASNTEDRCPFARSFRGGFSGCEGFDSLTFAQQATFFGQVRPIVSCANLEVGRLDKGSFYPRCRLGGAAVFAPVATPQDSEHPQAV